MSSILVVDDMAIFRDPIAASLRLAGHTAYSARDGVTGLAEMRSKKPDLVLLDISMPQLDGLSVLRAMRRDPSLAKTPVILLTALVDKKFVVEAAKLGVKDYLLKATFSLAELNNRIKRLLSPPMPPMPPGVATASQNAVANVPANSCQNGSLDPGNRTTRAQGPSMLIEPPPLKTFTEADFKPLMNSQQCIHRVEACLAGKTLSGAVAEVMMLAGRPSAELKDLAALINRDPVLSVRVLQMANSAAFFSRRGAVTTITEAVKNIGANNVRNIAASVGIFDAMPSSSPDGFNPIRCWQHLFAVGQLCESFVAPSCPAEAGVAYLVGLCHDLGEIMFRTQFEAEYRSVLEIHQDTGTDIEIIERHMLGMTQKDILNVILRCLGLPETIRNPIERFQKGVKAFADSSIVLRALAVADSYANGLLLASSDTSLIWPIPERCWASFSARDALPLPNGEELRTQVHCLTAILSRMSATEQAELLKSPYKKSDAKVWIARDPIFALADPLAALLCGLVQVEAFSHLPTPEQAAGYKALIIQGRGRNIPGWGYPEIDKIKKQNPTLSLIWLVAEKAVDPSPGSVEPSMAAQIRQIADAVTTK